MCFNTSASLKSQSDTVEAKAAGYESAFHGNGPVVTEEDKRAEDEDKEGRSHRNGTTGEKGKLRAERAVRPSSQEKAKWQRVSKLPVCSSLSFGLFCYNVKKCLTYPYYHFNCSQISEE